MIRLLIHFGHLKQYFTEEDSLESKLKIVVVVMQLMF